MAKMKPISKKTRFEIFKRDKFTCGYCGGTPPEVVLEIDHIDPVSKGGGNDLLNLITACFNCNRGKSDIPLESIPASLSENIDQKKERELQISEYRKFIKSIKRRENRDLKNIEKILQETYPNRSFTTKFKKQTLVVFINKLPIDEIEDALWLSTSKISDDQDRCIRYFCGVCWRKIKGTARW